LDEFCSKVIKVLKEIDPVVFMRLPAKDLDRLGLVACSMEAMDFMYRVLFLPSMAVVMLGLFICLHIKCKTSSRAHTQQRTKAKKKQTAK